VARRLLSILPVFLCFWGAEQGLCQDLDPADAGSLDGGSTEPETSGGCQCGLDARAELGLFPLLALVWVARRRSARR
jgi:hypothetical protein